MKPYFPAHARRRALSSRAPIRRRHPGFTIVELMITLTIAVVLIAIAVPSFRSITLSSRLTTTANDVVGAINTARMEAIKRNTNTQLCSNAAASNGSDALGTACGTSVGAVVVLVDGAATQIHAGTTGITTPIKLNGDMVALRFGGQGLGHTVTGSAPYSDQVVDICTASLSSKNHRVISMVAGSVVSTATTTGACP
jgi:type IV fimbrial biogenesis protein FimT